MRKPWVAIVLAALTGTVLNAETVITGINHCVYIQWHGPVTGANYRIEAAGVVTGPWQRVANLFTTNEFARWSDPYSPDYSRQFYRVCEVNPNATHFSGFFESESGSDDNVILFAMGVEGACSYRLHSSADAVQFSDTLVAPLPQDGSPLSADTVAFETAASTDTYFRVVAITPQGGGPVSQFTFLSPTNRMPKDQGLIIVSPTNNQTVSLTPTFDWQAYGPADAYIVFVEQAPALVKVTNTTWVYGSTCTATYVAAPLESNEVYNLQIWAVDEHGTPIQKIGGSDGVEFRTEN